jgi:hypothetical protein
MGQWKITWIDAPFGESDWQLFDLSTDPGETRNLATENLEQLQRLLKRMLLFCRVWISLLLATAIALMCAVWLNCILSLPRQFNGKQNI